MSFSELDKLKALAIVHIFETSEPFGDYAACAVLDDGAGVSYGINQFTHRSGSLLAVVQKYLADGGRVGRETFARLLPILQNKSVVAINTLSKHQKFKNALQAAAETPEMQAAQRYVGETRYLQPAIDACEGSNFVLPLSLAVIYDSINHGSYGKLRDRVRISRSAAGTDLNFEQLWIDQYVRRRDGWLESIPRLAPTDYRTDFFIAQLARKNWNLDLPLNVQGVRLTDAILQYSAVEQPAVIRPETAPENPPVIPDGTPKNDAQSPVAEEEETSWSESALDGLAKAGEVVEKIGKPIDTAVEIGNAVQRRKDGVTSMRKGVVWQAVLAVFAFLAGVPWEVWLIFALVTVALIVFYKKGWLPGFRSRKAKNSK